MLCCTYFSGRTNQTSPPTPRVMGDARALRAKFMDRFVTFCLHALGTTTVLPAGWITVAGVFRSDVLLSVHASVRTPPRMCRSGSSTAIFWGPYHCINRFLGSFDLNVTPNDMYVGMHEFTGKF